MRIVAASLLLAACGSNRYLDGCTSGDICAGLQGTAMVVSAIGAPYGAADRRMRANRITGTCDVQPMKACGTILLTITDARGDVRKAWVQDREFEIGNLTREPFTVVAESEALGVSSKVENVKLGQTIQIRLAQPK